MRHRLYYTTNDKVDTILNNTVSELENLQIRPNHGMPPTIAQSGRAFTHPAQNVVGGDKR